MSILVVGSVAFDDLKTPSGVRQNVQGGSATYFSIAASYFTDVRVVGVVGEDFTAEHESVLRARGVDTRGLEHAPGRTFHWGGEYGENLNEAQTKFTDLNVFESFQPKIPECYLDSEYLFLANIQPELQLEVREKMPRVKLAGGDTMNLWIDIKRDALMKTLAKVDVLLINDGEARLLSGETSVPRAAKKVLEMGPRVLVVKHGEYGATVFFRDGSLPFRAPALPLDIVEDPTGAGDSFAGGFMGYTASQGELTPEVLKRAMFYGSVMGSFAVEKFGTDRTRQLTREQIDRRFELFRQLTHLS
jgi:sugar/nucleoside kinase (ribokinase family)